MKKKRKVNKKKFFSRIIFLILLIVLLIFIIKNIGSKDEKLPIVSIFINNENVSKKLLHEPYINKDKVLYLSKEDVSKIFDKNIYYEEEPKKIITTSGTKVAAIDVKNNIVELNSANIVLAAGILDYGDTFYIPVSDLKSIYNIESFVNEDAVIISSLYDEFITIKTTKKISVKEKTSSFSKTLQKLSKDEEVIFIGEAEKKGWIKVLSFKRKYWLYKR